MRRRHWPDQAARAGPSTASHRADRTVSARPLSRRFAATMPSIMSATTAAQGRPLSTTATVDDCSLRRMDLWTSAIPGGLLKVGTWSPQSLAALPSERAASANLSVVASIAHEYPRHL